MQEVWKSIPGFEGHYEVSSHGRVRSVPRQYVDTMGRRRELPEKILRPKFDRNGYLRISLSLNSVETVVFVHRLVATAFIPNLENKPYINHIDGNKSNPCADNLEWCTASENNLHRSRVLKHYNGQPKRPVVCTDTGEIYESIYAAAVELGLRAGGVLQVCRGKYSQTGGLHFEFIDETAER